jgi:hypothetical protein
MQQELQVQPSLAGGAQDVYKTPSGKKYHPAACRMVNNVSEKISITRATDLGLEPCKICHPYPGTNNVMTASHVANGESHNTVQCKGITKNGTRCKHMTSIANGYCFQHNPDK